jgi:hypothetical protein
LLDPFSISGQYCPFNRQVLKKKGKTLRATWRLDSWPNIEFTTDILGAALYPRLKGDTEPITKICGFFIYLPRFSQKSGAIIMHQYY